MKNFAFAIVIALLAATVGLLWRLETHMAAMAELARVQLGDRAEARRLADTRALAEQQAAEAARAEAARAAHEQAAADAATAQRARDEAARIARLAEPVKPGEVVPEITLENRELVRNAVVVAVQASSVSFKAGARLYNVPTGQLPEELRLRVGRMFPEESGAAGPP